MLQIGYLSVYVHLSVQQQQSLFVPSKLGFARNETLKNMQKPARKVIRKQKIHNKKMEKKEMKKYVTEIFLCHAKIRALVFFWHNVFPDN
jgi:hypothetical protein